MNILIYLITLFIFIYALLILNIPQIAHGNHFKFKLYIFSGVFIFEFIIEIFMAVHNKHLINIGKITKNSILVALISTVAYSVYNDVSRNSNYLIANQNDPYIQNLVATIIIIMFVACGYFIETVITSNSPKINDYINKIYQ